MGNKKVFLDTNIILDFLDKKRANHLKVESLMRYLILNDYTIVLSEDMLSTIFYINKDNKKVLNFFKMILVKWKIVSYGVELIQNAVDIAIEKSLDLEDLMQCLCAKSNGCTILITEDKGFYDCGVEVYNTNDFLKAF